MGWKTRKLNELFDIGSSKRVLKAQWQKAGVPFYRGREITALAKCGSVENELFITQELYEEYAKKYGAPAAGDIVVTAIGTIGNTHIVRNGEKFYFKDASVLWLKKISQVDSEYVNYWFKSSLMKEQLDAGNGATVDTLTIKKLQSLNIYFPSLLEQKQIVAILDDAFANIDHARQLAERNLKNARELFDSSLNQIFTQRSEGWIPYRLSELCELISGQHIEAKDYNTNHKGIGYLTGPSDFGTLYPVVSKWTEHPKRMALNKDILITVKGSGVGKINMMNKERLAISRQLMAIRTSEENRQLIYWFLVTQYTYFQSLANGAAIPGISRSDVLSLEISLPSGGHQKSLVKMIEELHKQTIQLEKIYQQKITTLDELKQSLLQKVFRGELTQAQTSAA